MYMFSLQYFNNIFNATISSAPVSDDLNKRLNTLLVCFTFIYKTNILYLTFFLEQNLFIFLKNFFTTVISFNLVISSLRNYNNN